MLSVQHPFTFAERGTILLLVVSSVQTGLPPFGSPSVNRPCDQYAARVPVMRILFKMTGTQAGRVSTLTSVLVSLSGEVQSGLA